MQSKSLESGLEEMARVTHELLLRSRRSKGPSPATVLELGAAVVSLSDRLSGLFELNRFLEEAVLEELLAERRSLAEDLDLLENLLAGEAGSPDAGALAAALTRRIEKLLEREQRVFYQPLVRLELGSEGQA